MVALFGKYSTTRPWVIVLAWVALGGFASLLAPNWDQNSQDDDVRFLPARCASVRGFSLLSEAFPDDVSASRLILSFERETGELSPSDFALVDTIVSALSEYRLTHPEWKMGRIVSHRDPFLGKRLVSRDGKCTLVQVPLSTPYLANQTRLAVAEAEKVLQIALKEWSQDKVNKNHPTIQLTGPAGIGHDLISASANGLEATTGATIALVVVVLLVVHKAPLLALIPLVTIALSVWVALKLLAVATLIPGFYLVNVSKIFAVVMLYGAGTDYCLFLISRYKEELSKGYDTKRALIRAMDGVGNALIASALTVICGLGFMVFAEFVKIRCGGPAIAVSLGVALLASMSLTPAMLYLLGPAVFWPGKPPGAGGPVQSGIWDVISHMVVARPKAIWIGAMLLLLPLAFLGLFAKASYRATAELNPNSSSILGLQAIQRHFPAGETGPLTVLIESPKSWRRPEGQEAISRLTQVFGSLPHISEVRSLTQPLGNHGTPALTASKNGVGLPLLDQLGLWKTIESQVQKTIQGFYLATLVPPITNRNSELQLVMGEVRPVERHIARFDLVMDCDPFEPEAVYAVDCVELWLKDEMARFVADQGPVRGEVVGMAVSARDMAQVVEADRFRVNILVLAGVWIILWVVVRKPWLAVYLLATVLLSYFATLGATMLLAQHVFGRVGGEVDWRVPFFLFVILVAVGEDYNILLMSRMLEKVGKLGPTEAMREALASTGGTITSCGLIMAGTFATLAFAGLSTLVQIGFSLAFGVLLDTFLVRPFLVPAFVLMIWKDETYVDARDLPNTQEALDEHAWRKAV